MVSLAGVEPVDCGACWSDGEGYKEKEGVPPMQLWFLNPVVLWKKLAALAAEPAVSVEAVETSCTRHP